jgi:PAS domain S-box-containing protein
MSEQVRLKDILESITGGFFALNSQYCITYWNHAAEAGTGLRETEVLGKNVFEVFPNASGAPLGEMYKLAMETKTFQNIETSYKDERFEAWFDVRIYPAEDGLSVFFQDISEKKREQKRKEILIAVSGAINDSTHLDELSLRAAEKIASLFEVPAKLICIYLYDPRGNEIRLVAPALFDVEFPHDVVHQSVQPDAPHLAAQAALKKEVILSDDLTKSTVAGMFLEEMQQLRLKTLVVMPLVVQGELQGVLETVSIKEKDFIGEELEILSVVASELGGRMGRTRLIDELRLKNLELETQTQRAAEASDTLKKFLATFSHELRSPLNSIIGFSDLLTARLGELSAQSAQEFVKNIHTSGKHLQQIINDILDLSKIEAGKLELHIASYPVSYFQESVQRVLAAAIAEREIHLEFAFSTEFDEIVVDQIRFKQILINLISNAIKFSNKGGTVSVTSERVGNDIQFVVRDNGLGIKPEELPLLFKPFRQASSGREMNNQGIGLGLAITKKLVGLHGGTIWAESEWGKGTRVCFRIPMIVDAASERVMQAGMLLDALERQNRIRESGEKPLVLIVEDSPQAGELLRLSRGDSEGWGDGRRHGETPSSQRHHS